MHLLEALLQCSNAIILSSSKNALFEAICNSLVRVGGMGLAWIGLQDSCDPRLWPQAHCGNGPGYSVWVRQLAHVERIPGHALASTAVASQKTIWLCPDDSADDVTRTADLSPGDPWLTAAAIPLRVGDQTCAVLCLYSCDASTFDANTRSLLIDLALNLETALFKLEQKEQSQRDDLTLIESEARYNALFANNPMPILVVNPTDGRIVNANLCALAFYGWNFETITGKLIGDINTLSPEAIKAEMLQAITEGRNFLEFQHWVADGTLRDVEVFSNPMSFHDQTYLVLAIHDVTERRLLQAKAQQSQNLMQRFIDHLPGTAFVKDRNLRLVMANRRLGALLNMDPAAMVGKTAHDLFPAEFADFVTSLDLQVMETGESRVFQETFQNRHNETSMFVIDDGSEEKYLAGLSVDVTESYHLRERTSALLHINEMAGTIPEKEFLTTGLEMAESLTHSSIGFLHFVNEDQESLELITWTAGALKGCTAAYDSHYPVSSAGIWADCVRIRQPVIFNDYGSRPATSGLPKGHAPIARLISVPVIENGKVRMVLGVGNKKSDYIKDDAETLLLVGNELWRIARRNRLEASLKARVEELVEVNKRLTDMQLQLLQSEKMASIGQLASGIAHEINNPIGFVKSNLGALQNYVSNLLEIVTAYEAVEQIHGDAVAEALKSIEQRKQDMDYEFVVEDVKKLIEESNEGVQRVSKIVQDLKNFSRTGDVSVEPADLQAGIESTINVVWNQLKYKVDVVREYAVLPPVQCVISQINQVVMNLLINAEQAISGRGTITIRTGQQSDTVWIEVQDTGCGIEEDKLSRIFEPFYTSKPLGQGTGLGLSISFGIVQRHGGKITVQSEVGNGSTFRVTLPIESAMVNISPVDQQEPT